MDIQKIVNYNKKVEVSNQIYRNNCIYHKKQE